MTATSPELTTAQIAVWRERIRTTTFANYHLHMGIALALRSESGAAQALQRACESDPGCVEAAVALAELTGDTSCLPAGVGMRQLGLLRLADIEAKAGRWERAGAYIDAMLAVPLPIELACYAEEFVACTEILEVGRRIDVLVISRAIVALLDAASFEPDLETSIRIGHLFFRHHAYDEAAACYRRYERRAPGNLDIRFRLGFHHMINLELAEAEQAFIGYTARLPDDRFPVALRVLTVLADARAVDAAGLVAEEEARQKLDSSLWACRGLAFQHLGDLAGALAAYEKAAEIAPSLEEYRRMVDREQMAFLGAPGQGGLLALGLLALGRLPEAKAKVDGALRQLPESGFDWLVNALLLLELSAEQQAREAMKAFQAGSPNALLLPLFLRLLPMGADRLRALLPTA
ncbi:tetratricopeptide repeat protein [Azospirillum griseum]|uniref:tetratricopeptide repeat protein n=1 Tax=Azospirillum griseum TaxID=2496639 RepID=UPI00131522F4|nr:tetratricopeptide repeat protein [Azospirillum griseum]